METSKQTNPCRFTSLSSVQTYCLAYLLDEYIWRRQNTDFILATDRQTKMAEFYLLLYSTHTQIYYLWSLRFVHLKKKLFLWCFKKIEKTWFCDLYSLFSFHFLSKSLFKDGPRENISSKRKNICPWDGKLIMDELILINLLSIFLWRGEVVGARDASVLNLRWIIPKT